MELYEITRSYHSYHNTCFSASSYDNLFNLSNTLHSKGYPQKQCYHRSYDSLASLAFSTGNELFTSLLNLTIYILQT